MDYIQLTQQLNTEWYIQRALSHEETEKRIRTIKIANTISTSLLIAFAVYSMLDIFENDKTVQMIFAASMMVFFIVNLFSPRWLYKKYVKILIKSSHS